MDLIYKAKQIRKTILKASYKAGACHIGSALSCVEILVDLFYKSQRTEDRFIFSKASGVATYYTILADKKIFPRNKLVYYLKNYPLPSKEVPGVIHSTGSLGMGLSVAVGLALADRKRKVYCLISDGELEEGNTWEAIMSAYNLELDNLIIHLDYNGFGACKKINLPVPAIIDSFKVSHKRIPEFHIHVTKKGQGVDFMENSINWHYRNMTKTHLEQALKQL